MIGSPLISPEPPNDNEVQRLLARAVRSGQCRLWTGYRVKGYGRTTFRRKQMLVHRVIFAWANQRWPRDKVLHTCDRASCIEPAHLFEGTQADNMADMVRKGRASRARHRNAKLTVSQVAEIRRQLDARSQRQLAARYGVSQATISDIACRRTWLEGGDNAN